MAVTLGHNQYGKAETRVVRVFRDADPHEIVDYNVSVALSGDFADIHLTGDNTKCLTTDATKNTVNAFAKEQVTPSGSRSRSASRWRSTSSTTSRRSAGSGSSSRPTRGTASTTRRLTHPHAFARDGGYVRTATVTYDGTTSCGWSPASAT